MRKRLLPESDESLEVREVWLKVFDKPALWVRYRPEALEVLNEK